MTLAMIASGTLLLVNTDVAGNYLSDLLGPALLLGVGAGLCYPPIMTLALSTEFAEDVGAASGLVNTCLQVGGAVTLAILASVAAHTTARVRTGTDDLQALNAGFHAAYSAATAIVVAAIVVASAVLGRNSFRRQ